MKRLVYCLCVSALALAGAAPLTAQTAAPANPAPPKKETAALVEFKVTGTLKEEDYTRANKDTGEVAKLTRWVLIDEQGRLVLLPTATQLKTASPNLKVDLSALVNQPVTMAGHGIIKQGRDAATGAKISVLYVTDITSVTVATAPAAPAPAK